MIAFFIARADVEPSGETVRVTEFARYRQAMAGMPIEEYTSCDEIICNRRKYLVKHVGEQSACVICESLAPRGGRMLRFNQNEDEILRLSSVVERVTAITDTLNVKSDKTWIFLHNGGDIPSGYEVWANNMLHEADGYAEWNIALLSGQRDRCFDLEAMQLREHLDSELNFENWADDLGAALLKVGEISLS